MTRSDLRDYPARFADGKTAASYPATVSFGPRELNVVRGDTGRTERWKFADLRTSNPVRLHHGDVVLHEPGSSGAPGAIGATVFVDDEAFVQTLLEKAPHLGRKAHLWRFAKPGLYVSGVMALIIGAVWAFDLSPARAIANLMPMNFREKIGESAFRSISGEKRICTTPEGYAAVERLLARLTEAMPENRPTDIRVVEWSLANAFALPGGRVVLTSGLIADAKSPDEVAGVLAHEIGHVINRDPETAIVRALGLSLATKIMFAGSSDTLASAGALLAQLQYSRDAERAADSEGLHLLKVAEISPVPLGNFFDRMQAKAPSSASQRTSRGLEFISTHPNAEERAEIIKNQPAYPSRASLEEVHWDALRAICGSDDNKDATISGGETETVGATEPDTGGKLTSQKDPQ